jgi:hypothetical protein
MLKVVDGVVHGGKIELDEPLGLEEGQRVKVRVQPVNQAPDERWGDGLRRCAGALADDWTEEDDQILDAIYRGRQTGTRAIPE